MLSRMCTVCGPHEAVPPQAGAAHAAPAASRQPFCCADSKDDDKARTKSGNGPTRK